MAGTNHRRSITMWVVGSVLAIAAFPTAKLVHTVETICYLRSAAYGEARLVPYAHAILRSDNPYLRDAAARGLGQIGPVAAPAVPDLLVALRDGSPDVAPNAAWALGHIYSPQYGKAPPPSQEVLDALIEALDHRDGEIRRYAVYAIFLIGPAARSAAPDLARKLKDDHMGYTAVRALGEMGPAARKFIPAMTDLLSSPHWGTRAEAALALSRLRPLPPKTVSAIEQLLKDDDEHVRTAASKALANQPW